MVFLWRDACSELVKYYLSVLRSSTFDLFRDVIDVLTASYRVIPVDKTFLSAHTIFLNLLIVIKIVQSGALKALYFVYLSYCRLYFGRKLSFLGN